MTRTFVETPIFTKNWHSLGLTDDDLKNLQEILLENPKAGDVIKGTGGLRKIRISCNEHGKRGGARVIGARVIYVDVEFKEKIHLINVYAKNEQSDLTESEKKAIAAVIRVLKEEQ